MAKIKWINSGVRGIRYREKEGRKNGKVRMDRYYTLRFQHKGKSMEEALGWESEGMSFEKAVTALHKLKEACRLGEGPTRLSEKRELSEKKKLEKEKKEKQAITFISFFETHYLPLQTEKSAQSLEREKSLLKTWVGPVIGNTGLKDVSIAQLEKIKSNVAAAGRSQRSALYCISLVRQVFNTAARLEYFTGKNPASLVKKPKFDNGRLRFLTVEQAESLLFELKKRSVQTHDIALTSLHCGLRAKEIFSLKWQYLDFDQALINVVDTKNMGKNRRVFMTKRVLRMLQGRFNGQSPDDLVFPDRRNGKTMKHISKVFPDTVKNMGLNAGVSDRRQKIVFHSLRHSYASWSVQNGVSLYELQKLLGHQSLDMVMRYSHLLPDGIKIARDRIEAAIDSQKRAFTEK